MALAPTSSRSSGSGVTVGSYVQFTGSVAVAATTAAAATTIVTAASVTVPAATLVTVEVYAPRFQTASAETIFLMLWQDSTDLGMLGRFASGAGTLFGPVQVRRYLTPGAGAFTYSARAYSSSGTSSIQGGAGGTDTLLPGYIRVTTGS